MKWRVRWHRVLRWLVGISFIVGAGLKLWGVSSGGLEGTVIWRVAGGSAGVVVALACLEVAVGASYLLGLWTRATALILVGMLIGFSAVLLTFITQEPGSQARCGCYGSLEVGESPYVAVLHNAVLIVAVFVATDWTVRAPAPDTIHVTG